jgi:hypothetical protein
MKDKTKRKGNILHLENSLKEKRRNGLIISTEQQKVFLVCRVLHCSSCFS